MPFNLFKKAKLEIFMPVNGQIIPLEEVPDPVFNQKMIGEGIAVMPSGGAISSPVEGSIIQVTPSKHAIGIQTKDGTEILIHIGLETVALNGEGFNVRVDVGDKVSVGQPLIDVDWDYIKSNAKSMITPVVITNSNEGNKVYTLTDEKEGIQGKTVIITASSK